MKSWLVGLLVLSLVGFSGCAKKSDLNDNPNADVGLYKATGEKMVAAKADFFIITTHKSLFLLQKDQTKYTRAFKGNLSSAQYTLSEGKFESGDIQGTKMTGTEADIPDNIRLMAELNLLALKLMELVNPDGIKVSFRLELESPSFNENQRDILEKLIANKDVLVNYLKSKKLDEFWINDYAAYTKMYSMEKSLRLPALGAVRGDEVLSNLKESKNIDEN